MTELNSTEAFKHGSDIWVGATLEQSKWTRKLDWYLNLQILKSEYFKRTPPQSPILKILEEVEVPQSPKISEHAPLMVGVMMQIPARQFIVLPFHDLATWARQIHQIWHKLKRPSLRIFLPVGHSTDEFREYWPDMEQHQNVSLVASETER